MHKIKKRLLAVLIVVGLIAALLCPLSLAIGGSSNTTGKIVNCNYYVNVRSGPGTSYAKIGTAPKGATYTVTGKTGSWYKVDYNGRTAYIYAYYVKIISNEDTGDDTNKGTKTGKIVNCNHYVNVRSGPGTSYAKIGKATKGSTYTVTGKSGSWYKIKYSGRTAYIYAYYVKIVSGGDTGDNTNSGSETGQIVNCKYRVNVRSGPSTRYKKIGTAPKGDVYTILGTSGSWYKIKYNGRTGYIYGKYIKPIKPKPKPTATPKPKPTATPKPKPTATPKPKPTATPKPKPTATPKPKPKPTATPKPKPTPTQEVSKTVIAGYYASWAAYEGYTPLEIPADKLTHITYAFANISDNLEITMGDSGIDPKNFEKLRQLKQKYTHIKTLISIGGWLWSGRFSDAARTDESRTKFADSVVAFMKQYGFDGVDIDWEFPVEGGKEGNVTRPEDKTNFTLLMAKLREKLDVQGSADGCHYLLSFAGASTTYYANTIELDKLTDYVDFAKLMCYDMHGSWDSYTDFNAPLYMPQEETPQFKWSCEDAVDLWIGRGFDKSKIVMGIPLYGNVYTGVNNANDGLYQTYGTCTSVSYDDIASDYLNAGYSRYVDSDALVPWLFNGSTFVSYDDAQSIAEKADFVKSRGIRGAAVWELSQSEDGKLIGVIYSHLN